MNRAIQEHVVPVLRDMGFRGSLPHFRRQCRDRVDLLTFQFNKYGGSFVVELAQCGSEGHTTHWGKVVPANKVTAHDINLGRQRLTPPQDDWFRFDDGHTPEEAISELLPLLQPSAESFWGAG